jgi:TP901 family phage tail tape measure protein
VAKKDVDVRFNLIDNFTSSFKKTIETLTAGTKKAQNAWKSVEKFGNGISSLGTKATAAVTMPLVGLAAASATEFGSVDKSLKLVQQTMGATDAEAKGLESAIKSAAANSVYGMQDAADAALNFARQGFDAAQAADMIAPAMDLAAGTATDLSVITGGVGNALKIFSDQGLNAMDASNMLAKAQAQANTTVQDLFDAMSTAGPMLDSVGWSFKDLAVITDVFGDAGISGSKGAEALKTGLARLASPAKDGADALKQLGLNFFDSTGKMDDMLTMQKKLHDSFAGLNDQEKMSAASAMFGKEQMGRWLTLIEQSPDTFAQYTAGLKDSTGAANNMANALLSGPGGAVEKLKSSFDVFKYTVGDTVANTITPFVEKVTGLLDKFNNMDEAQQKQIIKWAAMAAAVGPGLIAFGKVISTIGRVGMSVNKFIGIASKAAGGFKELHTGAGLAKAAIAAITSPVGIVLGVIAALAIAVIAIKTHFDTFKAGLSGASPAFEKISANFQKIKDALQPFIDKVVEVASVVMDVFGNVFAGACGAAVSFFAGAFAGITQYITGFINVVQGIITFITGVFTLDWEKAWSGVQQIFSGIVDEIMGLISMVTGAFGGLANGVKAIFGMDSGSEKATSTKKVSGRAIGDRSWRGGLVQVHERGGEILDLPQGTRIYPHDVSMQMAKAGQGQSVNVAKLADQIVVREEADIVRIADELMRRIKAASGNMGGVPVADMA